jgi:hypothetical protein
MRKSRGHVPLEHNLTMCGDKSFADDLIARLGAVSGRVALLLRSAEAKPTSSRFVPMGQARAGVQAAERAA